MPLPTGYLAVPEITRIDPEFWSYIFYGRFKLLKGLSETLRPEEEMLLVKLLVDDLTFTVLKMIKIKTSNEFGETTIEEIKSFETLIGNSLPDEYRTFLLAKNGGQLLSTSFESGKKIFYHVSILYGLFPLRKINDLKLNYTEFRSETPEGTIRIGNDSGGGEYLLNLISGKILFWDHNRDRKNLIGLKVVASSFESLTDGLYEEPEFEDEVTVTEDDDSITIE